MWAVDVTSFVAGTSATFTGDIGGASADLLALSVADDGGVLRVRHNLVSGGIAGAGNYASDFDFDPGAGVGTIDAVDAETIGVNLLTLNDTLTLSPGLETHLVTFDGGANAATTAPVCGTPVVTGDALILDYQSDVTNASYELTATSLTRNAVTIASFAGIETVRLLTGTGQDDVTLNINAAGLNGVSIQTGDGVDTVRVQATPASLVTEIFAGAGNDIVNISSDGTGTTGNLSAVLGPLCMDGGGHAAAPTTSATVVAKGQAITTTVVDGDTLNLGDQAHAVAATYTLSATAFDRDLNVAAITLAGIETIHLTAGAEANDINVLSTPTISNTTITSQNAPDTIDITTTGADSILLVNSAGGADAIDVANTGGDGADTGALGSVTRINAGDAVDVVTLVTTSARAGVSISGDAGGDPVSVQNAGNGASVLVLGGIGNDQLVQLNAGANSRIEFNGEAGTDTLVVRASAATSQTQLNGGTENDTFTLGSVANLLTGIAGTVMVDGGAQAAAPTATASVTAAGQTITRTLQVGDTLTLNDQARAAAATYNLSATAFNRDTTVAATVFTGIETINLNAGTAANDINVLNTPASSNTTIVSQDAADAIDITTTGTNSILVVNAAGSADPINVANTGAGSVTQINAGDEADAVIVTTSGANSGVAINGDAGSDALTVQNTGSGPSVLITGGAEADAITLLTAAANSRVQFDGDGGADALTVRALVSTSQLQINGGTENDTIVLGSVANLLNAIRGPVTVNGGGQAPAPLVTATVTAKGQTISTSGPAGDTLRFNDQGNGAVARYNLNATTFNRDTIVAPTTFVDIETIDLNAGNAANDINVVSTPAGSNTTIDSQDAADDIDITNTGRDAILIVNAAGGADAVDIANTGGDGADAGTFGSVTQINAGDGPDTLTLVRTGRRSGVALIGGAEADVVTVQNAAPGSSVLGLGEADNDTLTQLNAGATSRIELDGGVGSDGLTLRASALTSQTQLSGGADSDSITLGSVTNSLSGILGRVMVDGGAQLAAPTTSATVTVPGRTVTATVSVGDTLNLNDQGHPAGATYSLSAGAFNRGTTIAATALLRIETIRLNAGSAANVINVASTPASSNTTITGQDVADDVNITTTGRDSILVINAAGGEDSIDIANTGGDGPDAGALGSVVVVNAGDGDDTVTQTGSGADSGTEINGEGDDDQIVVLGSGAGSATDANGGAGNDGVRIGSSTQSLDPILGFVNADGGGNAAPTRNVAALPVPLFDAVARTCTDPATTAVARTIGDVLEVLDTQKAGNQSYSVDPTSVRRLGAVANRRTVTYATIERVALTAGLDNDTIDLTSEMSADLVSADGGGGADNLLRITMSAAAPNVIVGNAVPDDTSVRIPFELANVQRLNLLGDASDNQVFDSTGLQSLIDGAAGNDVLCTNSANGVIIPAGGDNIVASTGPNATIATGFQIDPVTQELVPVSPAGTNEIVADGPDATIIVGDGTTTVGGCGGGSSIFGTGNPFTIDVCQWLTASFDYDPASYNTEVARASRRIRELLAAPL